ncbi:hypothetical protein EDD27_9744 [Nonomuraea polychroma]|uniref:Uncharacterized protein n=1 Tax=Nonomuraea polychroma TaxID=46176 RepID=A0A438MMI5_9ACTN|nr:hypothetical protein [Nonomuraea polychroma]RVX46836.1 hypothetical protein EDD27_9744 [Nonomuraea polychroma]
MRFEEHLLMDLKAEITARAERRHRIARRLYAGGAVAALAAAAAFAVPSLTGTESPAYAVSKNADGTVRVEINEFEDADQLEQDLAKQGVRADISYLPAGKDCKPPRGKTTGQVALGPDSNAAARMRDGGLDIDPRRIGEDQTLVMAFAGTSQETAETKKQKTLWSLTASLITGRVGPCVVVDA